MNTKIKHVVFDIGKVLIHYDPNIPYSRLIPDADERQSFFDSVGIHDWNLEQDRGRTWQDAEDILIKSHPQHESNIRAFRKHWAEMVSHAYDDTVAILRSLIDQGTDVTMLTNFASDTFREAQVMYPFLTWSRGVTVSGDVKLIKPNVEIYKLHAKTFDLDPAASLFIDDSLANVEGAKAAGWQAVHFTDAAKLKTDLSALGVTL
jgi:2-haloacid dehalogenase